MELFILLKAGIRHRKSNFISIFILMLIVSTVLVSAISIDDNVTRRIREANDAIGTGDLAVFLERSTLSDEMLDALAACDCIADIKEIDCIISTDILINGEKPYDALRFMVYDPEHHPYGVFNNKFDAFIKNPPPLTDGAVYLPMAMKNMYACEMGDVLLQTMGDRTLRFTIAGFIEEPFTGCDVINQMSLFVTEHDFTLLSAACDGMGCMQAKMLHLFAAEEFKDDINQFCRMVNEKTGIVDRSLGSITREHAKTYTLRLPKLLCAALYLFMGLLLVVVSMLLSNNIGTSIEMEYVNLGVLKSQGFSKGRLRTVLLLQYLLPVILGSAVGILLSLGFIGRVRTLFIRLSSLLVPGDILLGKSLIALLAILLLLCVFIYCKTAKVGRISPVRAIAGGVADVHFSSRLRTHVLGNSKKTISMWLVLRQLTANMRQYVGTCLILSILVCYLSACIALQENFTAAFYDELYGLVASDTCVDYGDHPALREAVEADISAFSAIDGSFSYAEQNLYLDGVSYDAQVLDDTSYLKHVLDGEAPELDNEVALAGFLSKKIKKGIGDRVEIKFGDTTRECVVCGIYDTISFAGSTFAMTLDAAREICPDLSAQTRNYILADGSQTANVNAAINEKYVAQGIETKRAQKQSESTINAVLDTLNAMILLICTLVIIFTVIVIWMVCKRAFLKERTDIGIYKAYGFTSFGLRMQFSLRYLMVALAGSSLGVVLYLLFGDLLNLTTLSMVGITSFHAPLTPGSLLIAPAIILFSVFVAAFITLRRISFVNTRELIAE